MDNLDTIDADQLGRAMTGIGVNLLTRDVPQLAGFLTKVFGARAHQVSMDFALVISGGALLQLHHDATFAEHPLFDLLPEDGVRGRALQVYLFGVDPDAAVARAEPAGGHVVEAPADKPHGLREATILSAEGFAFTAAIARA